MLRSDLFRQVARIAAVGLCAAMSVAACAIAPPIRSLPSHIKRVYIPEFRNDSRQYAAQADLTLYVNDEFMVDGRLDVVQNERADVRLEGRVTKYRDTAAALNDDEFPLVNEMTMGCVVAIWDPYDADRIAPLGRWRVEAAISYVSDNRRSISETQTEARDRLYRQMAKNIVIAVMTTPPLPSNELEQKAVQRYTERQGKQKYEPVLTEPRFPKPTPPPRKR